MVGNLKMERCVKMVFDVLERPFFCRTKDTLRFQEMRVAIEQMAGGKTIDDLEKMSEEDNLFSAVSKSRAKEILSIMRRRLGRADKDFFDFFIAAPIEMQKILCIVTVMLDDRSFYTFMDEVYKEKLITGDSMLYKDDLIAFIHKLQARDDKAAGWSDAAIKKMRDNFKSILRDGGLISATGDDRQILRPLLTEEVELFLDNQGLTPVKKILTGER